MFPANQWRSDGVSSVLHQNPSGSSTRLLKLSKCEPMPDVFSKSKRSQVMARIRGSGNKDTELKLISVFRAQSIKDWRRNWPIYGKPDFAFPRKHIAVFVDGCFWHVCPKHCKVPKGNRSFWRKKLAKNKARDLLVNRTLPKNGWQVFRIWEHELTKPQKLVGRLRKLLR